MFYVCGSFVPFGGGGSPKSILGKTLKDTLKKDLLKNVMYLTPCFTEMVNILEYISNTYETGIGAVSTGWVGSKDGNPGLHKLELGFEGLALQELGA